MAADIAIVDIMLPAMTGFETCQALRAASDLPIVIVSAPRRHRRRGAGPRVGRGRLRHQALRAEELLARVRAHLRRRPDKSAKAFALGNLHVIPDEGVVRHHDGTELHLTSTEFRLLTDLARPTARYSHVRICSSGVGLRLLRGQPPGGRAHPSAAHKDRPDPSNPLYLVTVRGAGYKLVL